MRHLVRALTIPTVMLALAACGAESAPAAGGGAPAPSNTARIDTTPAAEAPVAEAASPTPPAVGTDPGERIPAFAVQGTFGETPVELGSQDTGTVTVWCAGSTKCPITNKYAARLNEIEEAFSDRGVQFVWLYPNRTETDDEKAAWHAEKDLAGVFVVDRDARIAKTLDIERTPEIVVTATDGTITYRGAIDDGDGEPAKATVPWLENALAATLAGKPSEVRKTVPAG